MSTGAENFTNITQALGDGQATSMLNMVIMLLPIFVLMAVILFVFGMFRGSDDDGLFGGGGGFFHWWYVLLFPLFILPFMWFGVDLIPIILFLVAVTIIGAIGLFMFEYSVLPSREGLDDFWNWLKKNFKW